MSNPTIIGSITPQKKSAPPLAVNVGIHVKEFHKKLMIPFIQ
jgi:hypothetical protein